MSKVPSRLYESTSMLARPLVRIQIGEYQGEGLPGAEFYDDDDIVSLKIIHGSEDSTPGLTPGRMEVRLKGELPVLNGSNIYVLGPSELETTGEHGMQWRFSGKITTQTVNRGDHTTTTIQAHSWVALATGSNVKMPVGAGWSIRDVINTLVSKLERLSGGNVAFVDPYIGNTDFLYSTDWDMTVSQALSKFLTDIGVHCFVTRRGYLKFRAMDRLILEIEDCAAGPGGPLIYPLERRQVLAPMDLEQTTANSKIGVKLKRRDSAGTLHEGIWTFGEGWKESGDDTVTEWAEFDWSHIKFGSEQYRWAINAESSRLFRTAFRSPTVRFDIPFLLNARSSYEAHADYRDWEMAKALLRVEPGDCIPFGRDWQAPYRGVKIVTGITETLTPDGWTLEFAVHPPQLLTGRYGTAGDPEPLITGQPWDRYDRTTDSYPGDTTADLGGYRTDQFYDIGNYYA